MPATFDLVTLDAMDSVGLARFWSEALGLVETEREDEGRWIVLGDSDSSPTEAPRSRRRLGIQRIDGLTRADAQWSGPTKARCHLDLVCTMSEIESELIRLLRLGAAEVRPLRREAYGSIATLADPEGNVFDLCAYAEH